ncbi:MAG: hypothetical protein KDD62_01965, partial [Bdellovibrionales bacterium]|nr:hypothetical protein [Bdellovibrionales bacterium]
LVWTLFTVYNRSDMNSTRASKSVVILGFLFFELLVLMAYAPALGYAFTYDDFTHIHNNALVVQEGFRWSHVIEIFQSPTAPGNLYRPLAILSYYLQYSIWGLDSFSFHLLNLLLHGLNAFLVWVSLSSLLSRPLSLRGSIEPMPTLWSGVPFATAILFALHPLHVEAVANVSGRTELLSCSFGLLAVILFQTCKWSPLAALSLFFACLSKESALVFGLVIGVAQIWGIKNPVALFKDRRMQLLALAGLGAFVLRMLILRDQSLISWGSETYHPENPFQYLSFFERVFPGIVYLGHYLYLMIIPSPLIADYSIGLKDFWQSCWSYQGLSYSLLLALYGFSILCARGKFFGLWFFMAFLITCNIFLPIGTVMGERLAYIPSIGFLSYLVINLSHLIRVRILRRSLYLVVCLAYLLGIQSRLPVWQNDLTLFQRTFVDAPLNVRPAVFLSRYWFREKKDLEAARKYLLHIYELDDTNLYSQKLLLHISLLEKRLPEAKLWAERILRVQPDDPLALTIKRGIKQLSDDPKS